MKLNQSKIHRFDAKPYQFVIVWSRFNDNLGSELFKNTEKTLLRYGAQKKNIKVYRVPGALEIPVVAVRLAKKKAADVIIALGVVIRGETPHFEHVSRECYHGLMETSLCYTIPIVFGVLTVNNKKQAQNRISSKKMNKGKEYAETAIEMAALFKKLR